MMIVFLGLLSMILIPTESSIVSTGDFNKDFFVTWSPSHVNTSAGGHERSLKLDQESGIYYDGKLDKILGESLSFFIFLSDYCFWLGAGFASNQMFLFGQIDMQIKLVPGHSAGTVIAYYVSNLFILSLSISMYIYALIYI